MREATLERSHGKAFDEAADEYDQHRPSYPDALLDQACALAALERGDRVLEIGCGTGQLTRSLLARGLHITALEPGDRMIALARRNVEGIGDAELVNASFEDAALSRERFRAVFAASAMHWIDPDVGWHKAVEALAPGGTLVLVGYFGLDEPGSADDQEASLRAIANSAPEFAASWPRYRNIEAIFAGAHERRRNVSDVWAWLGDYAVARSSPARLFDDAQILALPTLVEHTADELNALLATMSFWSRISSQQRAAIERENRTLHVQLGRPIRSSVVACAVTARRAE